MSARRALDALLIEEFGAPGETPWPHKAWPAMAASVLVRLAAQAHLVIGVDSAELLFPRLSRLAAQYALSLRPSRRIGNVMLDNHLDRPARLASAQSARDETRKLRRLRFRRANPAPDSFDLILNAGAFDGDVMAGLIVNAAQARQLSSFGFLAPAAAAQREFQLRLQLARYGMVPARGPA